MVRFRILKFPLCFFCLLFLSILTLRAVNSKPSQSEKNQETLQYEVTVAVKLIQVYVTDKDGKPVTDLEKSDFIIYDNGELKTITEFEKHILTPPQKEGEETRESVPSEQTIPKINRKFFLLFDFAFNDEAGILRSKKAALHFIDTQLHPTDEVGLLSYSSKRGLKLLEYLTTDHNKIRKIVESFREKNVLGRSEDFEAKYWQEITGTVQAGETSGRQGSAGDELARMSQQAMEFDRDIYQFQVKNFSKEMKDLAEAFRSIPGQKTILLFSAGIANLFLYGKGDGASEEGYVGEQLGISSLLDIFEKMSRELAASNSPVYAINTAGKAASHFKDRSMIGDASLRQLSGISGGIYFDNITQYESIARDIQDLTSHYYVLGYYIDEKWDGKFHQLKIEVRRKGCSVHAPQGYFNAKPFNKFSDFEKQLHLIDLALSQKFHFEEPIEFPSTDLQFSREKKSGLFLLSELTTDTIQEVGREKSELLTLVFDREENIIVLRTGELDLAKIPFKNLYLYSGLSLLPGEYQARIVVRNLKTGKAAVSKAEIRIPDDTLSGIFLYSPMLLMPEKNALFVRLSSALRKDISDAYPSLPNIFPFNPAEFAPLGGELANATRKIWAVIRCSSGSAVELSENKIVLKEIWVTSALNERTPVAFSILAAATDQNAFIFFVEIELPELKPGEYSLELVAEDVQTSKMAESSRPFWIK